MFIVPILNLLNPVHALQSYLRSSLTPPLYIWVFQMVSFFKVLHCNYHNTKEAVAIHSRISQVVWHKHSPLNMHNCLIWDWDVVHEV
jgi:hypothetical protein